MNLDTRTMMVTAAMLTLMFSGLLALAGLHAGNIRGVRQWALASLCVSAGMGCTIPPISMASSWLIVCGATLVATGLSLQYAGIRAFKEENCDLKWILAGIGLVSVQSFCFVFLYPDVNLRSISNSIVLALMSAASSRALLIPIKPPLRTAYWLTGTAFAVFAAVLVIRAIVIAVTPVGEYGLYSPALINPMVFLVGSVSMLFVTFGFALMLNYRLASELQDLAALDPLTGALNRRSLEKEMERLLARCARTGDMLAVVMLDIDHFKTVNDRFGHPVGDAVLRKLATIAHESLRVDDYFARYGGEEFCILMPSSTEDEALILAERLRQSYEAMSMEFNGVILHSTISLGVVDSRSAGLELSALLATADQALYCAKQTGRNRVVAYSFMNVTQLHSEPSMLLT